MDQPILEVDDLVVEFSTRNGVVKAVNGISFSLRRGETLGIVGESGSGKSVTALAILRLLPRNARIVRGQIRFHGRNILDVPMRAFRKMRGRQISMILQDPMTSLNPAFRIGWQVAEALPAQADGGDASRKSRVIELLRKVHIPAPQQRYENFPHQLSGGMRQRVVGAAAIAGSPEILICDEPTTSLDATIQAQYLQLLHELQRQSNVSIIFITHDFGVVAEMCHRVAVMYAGQIRETADVFTLFDHPAHPYTRALLASVPQLGTTGLLTTIPGHAPMPGETLPACAFAPRCGRSDARCFKEATPLVTVGSEHRALCWRAG